MEIASIVLIILLIVLGIWYGWFKPVESVAEMATDEVEVLKAERKAENIIRLADIELNEETVTSAKTNLASLNSIKF